jgi:feruloyl-CoA synthase
LLKALSPDIMDLVLCDANRPYLTMMAWPGPKADADAGPRIAEKLKAFNANRSGKSATIQRFALLATAPDPSAQEVSDKGSINRRAVIENRGDIVEQLYADTPPASIFCVDPSK